MDLFDRPDFGDEQERRIFHIHDDPKDCDEPDVHFGSRADLTAAETEDKARALGWW